MAKKKKSPTKKLLYFGIGLIAVFGLGAVLAKSLGWIGGENAGKQVERSKIEDDHTGCLRIGENTT